MCRSRNLQPNHYNIYFQVQKLNMKSCESENLSDAEGEKAKRQATISEQATNKDEHLYDTNFSFSVSRIIIFEFNKPITEQRYIHHF